MAFAHLHLHTQYSMLDGACRIDELMEIVKDMGMNSVAITDHGVMYGCVDFYKAAKKNGIKPIMGCEVYVAQGSRFEKTGAMREYAHLVLLCQNEEGYKNLTKLCSLGFTEGYYYKPRIDYDLLKEYSGGLIALSACLSGDIPKLLTDGMYEEAKALALRLSDIMGENNFFLELQDHGIAEQKRINPLIIKMSRETGIPLVITNDCHYLRKKDAKAQEILMCIQTGKTLDDENHMSFSTDEFYVKSEEEMLSLFPNLQDALDRTQEIADRCNFDYVFNQYKQPRYPTPNGIPSFDYLKQLCEEALPKKYEVVTGEVKERLDYELAMIKQMGFVDYFLIIWDFISFAKRSGISVGPGRGSGAASIVNYCLGITGLDPLKYNLLFERFLNPNRVSMPDIDLDFCDDRRDEVKDYIIEKYGADRVVQIITFGTMAARGAIQDCARVMGWPHQEAQALTKLIPGELGITIKRALESSPEFREAYESDPRPKELIDTAMELEGMPRNIGRHAAGIVVADREITDYIPIQTSLDAATTQFDMITVEELGLLKIDLLGLRTLTVIRDAIDLIEQRHGIRIDFDKLGYEDPATYAMMGEGDTDGCFQLESEGMRRVLEQLKPESLEDITAIISLYRPGPMDSIPRYIAGRHDKANIKYLHPLMKPILDVTYGCMVYQEQVIQLVQSLAGYSMGQADIIRRAMSKKKKSEMDRQRELFINGETDENGNVILDGAVRRGVPKEVASEIFDQMEAFASYAFNKAHAAAYAIVSYQTAYLKCHYLPELMAATMNSMLGRTGKIAAYIQYCKKNGMKLLPPDISKSFVGFTVEDDRSIRFGLGAVKNVGENAIKAIIEARQDGPYEDIFDFCERVDTEYINKRCVESLIMAGAFDSCGGNRAQFLSVYESALDSRAQTMKRNVAGQMSLFDMFSEPEDTKTIRPTLPDIKEQPIELLLQWEKDMTGIYISGHPLDAYTSALDKMSCTTFKVQSMYEEEDPVAKYDGQTVTMGGLVSVLRKKTTRSDATMAFLTLEDLYGTIECLIFPKVYQRYSYLLLPNAPIVINGRLSFRDDEEPKLIAETITALKKTADSASGKLALLLPGADASQKVLDIIGKYKGETSVYIKFADTGKQYRLGDNLKVDPKAEMLDSLKALLGEGSVKLI
ncbi:MAG: DNA polymerase III subunit alpha [Clostridia bacterium]|nr:DNA polymerase III subunit alpha [Clostridia bacterium]